MFSMVLLREKEEEEYLETVVVVKPREEDYLINLEVEIEEPNPENIPLLVDISE